MKPIINVQFMRALAALAVLVYHFSIQFLATGGSADHWSYFVFNQIGYAGVDFFFVISGYIMWVTTQKIDNDHPVLKFAYKRATRIYFGYWPYFLLAVIVIIFNPSLLPEQTNLWGSLLLTELETSQLLIQVAWTLQYELYFYALFAVLLLLPRAFRLRAIFSIILLIIGYQLYIDQYTSPTLNNQSNLLNFLLSSFCLEFFAGCLLAKFFQSRRIKYLSVVIVIGLLILIGAIHIQLSVIKSSLINVDYLNLRVLIFGTAAVLLLAAVIELELRGRILFGRLSTILGGASYSIYLSHTIVITLVFAFGLQNWILQNSNSPGLWILLLMALTVAYSILHYLWIEQPLMSMAKHIQKRLFRNSTENHRPK